MFRSKSLLPISVILPLLAACSGSGASLPHNGVSQSRSGAPVAACSGPLEAVSASQSVSFFEGTSQTPCATIGGLNQAQGMAFDAAGDLYVAIVLDHKINEYKPPFTNAGVPARVLHDGSRSPVAVAICKGYIAVTDASRAISIYKGRATSPTSILQSAPHEEEYYPTCDPAGNLYSTFQAGVNGPAGVNEFVGGSGAEKILPMGYNLPGGIQWHNNALWIENRDLNAIEIWYPPFKKAARTITLGGAGDTADFAVDSAISLIVTADNDGDVRFFNLQGGLQTSIPFKYPDAVAVSP